MTRCRPAFESVVRPDDGSAPPGPVGVAAAPPVRRSRPFPRARVSGRLTVSRRPGQRRPGV